MIDFELPDNQRQLGGPGSGNHGHAGRPGQVGGSAQAANRATEVPKQERLAAAQTNPLAHPSFSIGHEGLRDEATRYIAAYGQEFKAGPRPDGVEQGTPKQCYRNAGLLVMTRPDLTYVEGFASKTRGGLAIVHAWAVDADDNVIDPTLPDQESWHYFGIKYDRAAYLKYLYTAKLHGVLGSTNENAQKAIDTGGAKLRGKLKTLGGPGSGNFGHAGRPGQVGGSTSSDSAWGTSDPYVYHTTPKENSIESFARAGIKPSERGYSGAGVYMATTPEATLGYTVDELDEAHLFRVRKHDLIETFGKYPDSKTGVEHDDGTDEVILTGDRRVPPEFLEVKRGSEWVRLKALGGPGSGFFNHAGRPGQVGGSAADSGGGGGAMIGESDIQVVKKVKAPPATKEQIKTAVEMKATGASYADIEKTTGLNPKQAATIVFKHKKAQASAKQVLELDTKIDELPATKPLTQAELDATFSKMAPGVTPLPLGTIGGLFADIEDKVDAPADWPISDDIVRRTGANYIKEINESGNQFVSKLTADERDAVRSYTGDGSTGINKALRQGKALTSTAKSLDSALAKAPTPPPPQLVWRGVPGIEPDQLIASLNAGDVIRLKGFQSTSVSPERAYSWSSGQTMFEIRPSRGAYVADISNHPAEKEYLLPHGARYVVRGAAKVRLGSGALPKRLIQLDMLP